jgi:antitoxin component YwqK of YwqJK toxin-antitoxin module/peroxiredoxin
MHTTFRRLGLGLLLLGTVAGCKVLGRKLISFRDTWANGTTRREGPVEDGLQTGVWTFYHESGMRRARGRYQDDHQVGPWTYWYDTGVVEWSGAFDDSGKRTGEWSFHYPDDTLRASGRYLGDFEDGPWEFFAADGSLERSGQFDGGKLSGPWRHWYPGGKPKADGVHHRGQRIGTWHFHDEAGQERTQDFATRPGVEIVRETWPGGALRRVGVRQDGVPVGRWSSWHDDGTPRLACGFRDGQPHGVFEVRGAGGRVLAQGVLEAGAVVVGEAAVDGKAAPMAAGPLPLPPEPVEWLAADALAALAPAAAVGPGIAELRLPFAAAAVAPPVVAPPPPPAPIAAVVAELAVEERVPAPVQPDLTVTQREELDGYVLNYLDGPSQSRVSRRNYGPPGAQTRQTGPRRREELEGKPLPVQVFRGVDGTEVDTATLRGRKNVLVVILRGFVGEVCVYCVAQTEALSRCRDRLDALGIEVLVVYPGAKENEKSFEQAYAQTFGKGAPPYRVFYDPDLELVKKLGVDGDLAFPTTLIVDKEGIVRYAYVGEHRADRPAAKKLIELIEGMAK